MISKGIEFIKRIIRENSEDRSIAISDQEILQRYIHDERFPFLVSFPRTGSHWLRMIMELYFEKPLLVRAFYFKNSKDFLALHTHDMKMDIFRKNVLYLYRDPVPTVYSQMMYEKEDIDSQVKIEFWANLYGRHLRKWLIDEDFSKKKTLLRYENITKDIGREFSKITTHFGTAFDAARLIAVRDRVSKEEVKKKTSHDQKVINVSSDYAVKRDEFSKKHSTTIHNIILDISPELNTYFNITTTRNK